MTSLNLGWLVLYDVVVIQIIIQESLQYRSTVKRVDLYLVDRLSFKCSATDWLQDLKW